MVLFTPLGKLALQFFRILYSFVEFLFIRRAHHQQVSYRWFNIPRVDSSCFKKVTEAITTFIFVIVNGSECFSRFAIELIPLTATEERETSSDTSHFRLPRTRRVCNDFLKSSRVSEAHFSAGLVCTRFCHGQPQFCREGFVCVRVLNVTTQEASRRAMPPAVIGPPQ